MERISGYVLKAILYCKHIIYSNPHIPVSCVHDFSYPWSINSPIVLMTHLSLFTCPCLQPSCCYLLSVFIYSTSAYFLSIFVYSAPAHFTSTVPLSAALQSPCPSLFAAPNLFLGQIANRIGSSYFGASTCAPECFAITR